MLFYSLFFKIPVWINSKLSALFGTASGKTRLLQWYCSLWRRWAADLSQTRPPLLNRKGKVFWETASSTTLNTVSSNNNLKYNIECKKHALGSIQTDKILLFSRDFLELAWPQKAQSSREGSQRHSSREVPGGYVGVGLYLNKPGFLCFFSSLQFALPEYQNSNEELNSKTKSLHHKEGRKEGRKEQDVIQ